jgi:hypothetical protein
MSDENTTTTTAGPDPAPLFRLAARLCTGPGSGVKGALKAAAATSGPGLTFFEARPATGEARVVLAPGDDARPALELRAWALTDEDVRALGELVFAALELSPSAATIGQQLQAGEVEPVACIDMVNRSAAVYVVPSGARELAAEAGVFVAGCALVANAAGATGH